MAERAFFPMEDLRELMDTEFVNKQKINCIKHIRAMTGASLKETKDFFEQEWLPFINGDKNPPKVVRELVSDSPEFEALARQVRHLTEEVEDLRASQTRTRAKGIFNADET